MEYQEEGKTNQKVKQKFVTRPTIRLLLLCNEMVFEKS